LLADPDAETLPGAVVEHLRNSHASASWVVSRTMWRPDRLPGKYLKSTPAIAHELSLATAQEHHHYSKANETGQMRTE
jgi:hypothetical protein